MVTKSALLIAITVSSLWGAKVWASERVEATYNFIWKGFLVSTAEATADLLPETYDLAIDFRMRGVAKLFANGRSEVRAQGAYTGEYLVQPSKYISEGRWDGKDYSRTLVFDADGRLADMQQQWPEKWLEKYPREEVPLNLRRGPDPASLAVALMRARIPATATDEPFTVQAFDGDTVMEWQLLCSDETAELEASRHSEFVGPAHECTFGTKLLAGHRIFSEKELKKMEKERRKREKKAKKGKAEKENPPIFWVMEHADSGYLVPVRAEISSEMGKVRMYLKNLSVYPIGDEVTASR